jgi:hypothetical protein
MEPIEERKCGPAVLLVVSGDLAEELIVLAFTPVLVIDNRLHAGPHGSNARERKEGSNFLSE